MLAVDLLNMKQVLFFDESQKAVHFLFYAQTIVKFKGCIET